MLEVVVLVCLPACLADPCDCWLLLVFFALAFAFVRAAVVGELGNALLEGVQLLLELVGTLVARPWGHWRAGTVVVGKWGGGSLKLSVKLGASFACPRLQ